MAKDRWSEDPEPLARSIIAIVKTSLEGVHRKEYRETIERAKQAADQLVKEVETRHGKIKGKIIRRLIRVLRNHLPAREHPKYIDHESYPDSVRKPFSKRQEILCGKGNWAMRRMYSM